MRTESFTKQVPIAIAALGQHMHEHHLPLPIDIDINRVDESITVRVPDEAAQVTWLNTLAVDGEVNTPWQGPVWIKTVWTVRLPELGIRFRMIGLRRAPAALQSEPSLTVVPA